MLRAALLNETATKAATGGLRSDLQALQTLAELATWLQQYPCRELYCLPDDGASSDSLQGLGYMAVLLLANILSFGGERSKPVLDDMLHKSGMAMVLEAPDLQAQCPL